MHPSTQTTTTGCYSSLKILWVLSTVVLLSLLLVLNWRLNLNQAQKEMTLVAEKISNQVDGFLEALFQEIYTLPVNENELVSCKKGLYNQLQHITINHPIISGLLLTDSGHKLICTTLPEASTLNSLSNRSRSITGPYHLSLFEQPVYLIQQRLGHYHVGIVVISSALEQALQTTETTAQAIILRNRYEKKNILIIQRKLEQPNWTASLPLADFTTSETLSGTSKLQSIDGMMVVSVENQRYRLQHLWISQILVSLFFLSMSWLFYFLAKKLVTKHHSLHSLMKLALKNNKFYPVYQPVFDSQKGIYTGAEVLLRWQDEFDEILMPDFFIQEAETTGLIVPITLKIIDITFKETQVLLKERPDFHLAFNISALHFKNKDFFNSFYLLMKQYNIRPNQMIIEITERDLINTNDRIFTNKMNELRNLGFGLAVDDYGTGHASISYLQHFPFNYLKIDQLFVKAIGTKAITESLNDAIIQMAKQLNLMIIAEGVETKEQFDYLSLKEVRFFQGWYFSRAISIEQLMRLLQ